MTFRSDHAGTRLYRDATMLRMRGIFELVAIAEAGSLSAAARALGVSTAHVSRSLADLEQELGARLVHRTSRRSQLTEAGVAFHARCKTAIGGIAEAKEDVRQRAEELTGLIRVSLPGQYAERRIGRLFLEFAAAHEGIELILTIDNKNVDLVGDGFDIAIRAGPLASSDLKSRRLISFDRLTMGSPDLLRALGTITTPDDLDPRLCLSLSGRHWTFRHGEVVAQVAPKGRVESNSGAVLAQAAEAGLGLVQIPAFYGSEGIASGRLKAVLPDWSDDGFSYHLVYPDQSRVSHRVRTLIDFLVARIAADPSIG
jgi:DNA-binding transcriptional LysR family regulator